MGIVDFVLLFLYSRVYNLDSLLVGIALMLGKRQSLFAIFDWLAFRPYTNKVGKTKTVFDNHVTDSRVFFPNANIAGLNIGSFSR